MSTEEDARSGRPKKAAVTDENIKKVHKIIFDNRKVKLSEIAETLKVSKERVGHIVDEYLDMDKSGCRASSQPTKNNNVKLQELGFELLPHPPYSPDLAP